MSNLRSQIITETGQLTKLQLTLVQSETSLSWFYICDRQAGQTNKSTLFHCLFVLWTSCGGPTHRGEEDSLRLDMQHRCSARGEHLVLVLAGLPQGEAFIEMRCQGERVPETDMHRNRLSLKGCCYGKRGLQKQLKTETEWILQGCCCLQK